MIISFMEKNEFSFDVLVYVLQSVLERREVRPVRGVFGPALPHHRGDLLLAQSLSQRWSQRLAPICVWSLTNSVDFFYGKLRR
jgi:hypothetical protein